MDNFLFVQTISTEGEGFLPLGLANLSGELKRNYDGQVDVHVFNTEYYLPSYQAMAKALCERIKELSPLCVGFSSKTLDFPLAIYLARFIKKSFDIPIVVGGAHAYTTPPEKIIAYDFIDYVAYGDGEKTINLLYPALKGNVSISEVPGLLYKEGEKIHKTPLEYYEKLDEVPFPDWTPFVNNPEFKGPQYMVVPSETQRGCPFQCTYCCNNLEVVHDLGIRRRSIDQVMIELERGFQMIGKDCPVIFLDEVFSMYKKRTIDLLKEYKKHFKNPFTISTIISLADEDILKYLYDANCRAIWIGVESGDEDFRIKTLKKNVTNDVIREHVSIAKKLGMEVYTYNIIGMPTEEMKHVQKTIDLNRELKPLEPRMKFYRPFPNTEMTNLAIKEGCYSEKNPYHKIFWGMEYADMDQYFKDLKTVNEVPVLTNLKIPNEIITRTVLLLFIFSQSPKILQPVYEFLYDHLPPSIRRRYIKSLHKFYVIKRLMTPRYIRRACAKLLHMTGFFRRWGLSP